jgi:hypothetical protein
MSNFTRFYVRNDSRRLFLPARYQKTKTASASTAITDDTAILWHELMIDFSIKNAGRCHAHAIEFYHVEPSNGLPPVLFRYDVIFLIFSLIAGYFSLFALMPFIIDLLPEHQIRLYYQLIKKNYQKIPHWTEKAGHDSWQCHRRHGRLYSQVLS